ncbi:tripartite motif-containing protein 10 isoform X5 [Chelonia mydas]|uniref:tripartite motif-containing protein 10 isoform X5 n=1 Tax=Chelonia mydas TaxID=8469 RepID=UPI0018A1FA19|nr:tripartite motif-containing protein 10 isoform X5 [Chelonia mydas]
MAGAGGPARRLLRPRRPRGSEEAPGKHLACLRTAEAEWQSEELLKQTEAERQKIVAEWKELRGFLEEQEQRLLSQLEELARAIVKRRDEGVSRPSGEISLLGGKGQQQPRSQSPQGAGCTESSREDGPFQKPEPGFVELEKRLSDFSLKSAILQEVLLGFKETLRLELENNTGDRSDFVCTKCKLVSIFEEKVKGLVTQVSTLRCIRENEDFLDRSQCLVLQAKHAEESERAVQKRGRKLAACDLQKKKEENLCTPDADRGANVAPIYSVPEAGPD